MKALTAVFWTALASTGIALVMVIVTGVTKKKAEQGLPASQIALPAVAPTPAQ